jgi:hypothetical protein
MSTTLPDRKSAPSDPAEISLFTCALLSVAAYLSFMGIILGTIHLLN